MQSYLSGILRRMAPLAAIVAVLIGGGYWAWQAQAPRIVEEPHYHVGFDDITVTPLPEWITTDVKTEALRDGSIELPLSVLDESATERLAKAFAFHPWVAEVKQVRKQTGLVQVDLTYRRPVAMVELPPVDGKRGLYAVDLSGILLPSADFLGDPKKAARYPRLGGFTPAEVARVGSRWPDARIVGGARVAAALSNLWTRLNLAKITPTDGESPTATTPTFELVTQGGSRILWGHAPGSEAENEMPAEKKLDALAAYHTDHNTLDGRDGPQRLDVRGNEIVIVAEKPAAAADRK